MVDAASTAELFSLGLFRLVMVGLASRSGKEPLLGSRLQPTKSACRGAQKQRWIFCFCDRAARGSRKRGRKQGSVGSGHPRGEVICTTVEIGEVRVPFDYGQLWDVRIWGGGVVDMEGVIGMKVKQVEVVTGRQAHIALVLVEIMVPE